MPLIVDGVKRDLTSVVEWGRQKMQEGDYEKAAQHFCMALDLRPGFLQALVSRGFCYLAMGEEDRAQKDFAEVVHKDASFNRNIYVLMSLSLKRSGDLTGAIRYLNRCLSIFPGFKPALLARGELCLKVQDFERARADFRQVLTEEPVHLVARRGLADALRGLGNFLEALRQYSRAISDTSQAIEHQMEQTKRAGEEAQEEPEEEQDAELQEQLFEGPQEKSPERSVEETEGTEETRGEPPPALHESEMDSPSKHSFNEETPGRREEEQLMAEPQQLRAFLVELLMRRALVLRLMGNLEAAGSDFLDVLELEPEEGFALFWYGKILIEQQRHQEAASYLHASIEHHEKTRVAAHAILGALMMMRSDPNFPLALRHLNEAARLAPSSQSVRLTLWICSAAVALSGKARDPKKALSLLDRTLACLEAEPKESVGGASGSRTARASCGHVAGSGGAAAAALSARSRSAEEARWLAARTLVKNQQDLAKGDDLQQALECRTYLQLVAREPQQRAAPVPSLLFQLRVTALCDLCRWEDAVADCRQALLVDPGDEAIQFTMHVSAGILKFQELKFEAAIGCFTKALRLQPVNVQTRLHRAIALACAAWDRGKEGAAPENARVVQLLTDAVQDLEAVDQQAMIAGLSAPLGAAHLRAACLCSLGRPDDAWEALCESGRRCSGRRSNVEGYDLSAPRQRSLEAEVLVLLERHSEAIEACSAVLALNNRGHADARVMRAWCLSEIGEVEAAFEDVAAALILAPDRADIHEVYGDLCFQYGRLSEAHNAFGTAIKLREPMTARLAFKRALAHLKVGNLNGAEQELGRAVRARPGMPSAVRAKDGVGILSVMLKENWRHAHVRLGMMLQSGNVASSDGLPVIFLPHELMVYRGACSLYLGDSTAVQDFTAALDLARHFASEATWERQASEPCPETASSEGLSCFECECMFNLALCQLRSKDFAAALANFEKLCDRLEELQVAGDSAHGLAWFLYGICHLALDSSEHFAKDAFARSYSYDTAYVDDFLRRNGSRMSQISQEQPVEKLRPIGGCPPVGKEDEGKEDGGPAVVCCLQFSGPEQDSDQDAGTSLRSSTRRRLLSSAPIRFKVRDVVIWGRPSISWPATPAPRWKPPTSLARWDFCSAEARSP
ncbi:unnamed protein product [Durusdinium trenchii]|uniref:Uncharacterized protein n=2 Tax=Durusdinium trenchii TaxID=1381693 RepID=A0ABP0PVN4_9DINO